MSGVALDKDELIAILENEVQLLLHLISKVDPGMLDYRPTPKQRSLLELLQYLAIFPPVALQTIATGEFNMENWRERWQAETSRVETLGLGGLRDAIARQSALTREVIAGLTDADFRTDMEMFGNRASRGVWLVRMPALHYAAYRMQLFLYLKACGREELNTMNLWAGKDPEQRVDEPANSLKVSGA